ncbi:MAG: V-type ATP synthase subunit I [Roseibium sp.]|nr:V-type ATP synthase subunit I [Roseibium sp.]
MSIVPLVKVSLVGVLQDKEKVLEAAQAFGALHLIPLSSAQKELEAVPSGQGRDATEALRWLIDTPAPRRQVTEIESFDLNTIVRQAIENRHAIKECEDRLAKLKQRIQDVEPWGEFQFSDLSDIGDYRLWFYVVPTGKLKAIDPAEKIIKIVHRDRYRAHVVLLSPDEPPADAMPVPRVRMGAVSLSTLKRQFDAVAIELEDLQLQRQVLTKWRFLLAQNLAAARDQAARRRAALETGDADPVFVLQAWARQDQMAEIKTLATQMGVAAMFDEVSGTDNPPTLLENKSGVAAGENLVEFYQMPGYRDWDPSAIVYVSFIAFFGMIMTDAGYGLFLLALIYLLRGRFTGSALGNRLYKMSVWLMVSTTAFGIATGSYFGIAPPADSLLARLRFLDLKDVDVMMKITLTMGVAHIVLANVMRAVHEQSVSGRMQPIGWCLVALGGLGVFLGQETEMATTAAGAVVVGLFLVGFFGSDRKVVSLSSGGLRIFDGLTSLARIVNIFSDVLSYMRLFALGLAASSLAETVNTLSAQLNQSLPGVGLLIALAVLAIGHGINIALGLIAGCVHGLRLNVIEFFNWGLKEEGTPFRPFTKEETRP